MLNSIQFNSIVDSEGTTHHLKPFITATKQSDLWLAELNGVRLGMHTEDDYIRIVKTAHGQTRVAALWALYHSIHIDIAFGADVVYHDVRQAPNLVTRLYPI